MTDVDGDQTTFSGIKYAYNQSGQRLQWKDTSTFEMCVKTSMVLGQRPVFDTAGPPSQVKQGYSSLATMLSCRSVWMRTRLAQLRFPDTGAISHIPMIQMLSAIFTFQEFQEHFNRSAGAPAWHKILRGEKNRPHIILPWYSMQGTAGKSLIFHWQTLD